MPFIRRDALFKTALHEVCHASYASWCKVEVDAIQLDPSGVTVLRFPLLPSEVGGAWTSDPATTATALAAIIGTIQAPYLTDGSLMDARCQDLRIQARYKQCWTVVTLLHSSAPTWRMLCERAQAEVRAWIARPGARRALWALADMVSLEGNVTRRGWRDLSTLPSVHALWSTQPRHTTAVPAFRGSLPPVPQYPDWRSGSCFPHVARLSERSSS